MKQIFLSSVQKEFEKERALIKRMIESDPIFKEHFRVFVFEIDAPAADKTIQHVYLEEIAKSAIYLVLIGNSYGNCGENELSPTEREFDEAQKRGLVKIVMIRGSDNAQRSPRETKFLNKISENRVRVRFTENDLLEEVRNSIRDIMMDEGILSEIPFEDQLPSAVTMEDISEERVHWFLETATRSRNAQYRRGESTVDVLRTLHLVHKKTGLPTKAGILLFGKDPQYWFQSSQIKCAFYRGTEKEKPNGDIKLLGGDLFSLADQAIEYINNHINVGAGEHAEGASASDIPEIPNAVIAEAVNNAVAHRNYASQGSIQVEVYRDRIEIISPGRLHPALTIKDLYNKHESYPPNARIAYAFYQAKYIEQLGTGITDLLKRCRDIGLKRPVLEECSGRFRIVIWRKAKEFGQRRAEANLFSRLVISKLTECKGEGLKFSDLQQLMPNRSRGFYQSALRKLRKSGEIRMEGSTSSAKWFVNNLLTCNKLATMVHSAT